MLPLRAHLAGGSRHTQSVARAASTCGVLDEDTFLDKIKNVPEVPLAIPHRPEDGGDPLPIPDQSWPASKLVDVAPILRKGKAQPSGSS